MFGPVRERERDVLRELLNKELWEVWEEPNAVNGVKSQWPEWAEYVVRMMEDRPERLILDSHH